MESNFLFRFVDAVEVSKPRDMTKTTIVNTEYDERFLPTEIYR